MIGFLAITLGGQPAARIRVVAVVPRLAFIVAAVGAV